ncbi:MAG: hypothetical protein R3C56_17245 [Pirellulaceae bacterium]
MNRQERTGRFLITQLSDGAQVVDGKLVLDGKTGTLLGKSGKEIPFAYETPARPETPPENVVDIPFGSPRSWGCHAGRSKLRLLLERSLSLALHLHTSGWVLVRPCF